MSVAEPSGAPSGPPANRGSAAPSGLPRLELRVERLQLSFRFTLAFHAREVRFEIAQGDGPFERIFPETFSFHSARHDPTELFLQLDDLLTKPRLLAARANRRDARNLDDAPALGGAALPRRMLRRGSRRGPPGRGARCASIRTWRCSRRSCCASSRPTSSMATPGCGSRRSPCGAASIDRCACSSTERVEPDYLAAYIEGEVDPVDPGDDPSESGFFHVLEAGEPEAVEPHGRADGRAGLLPLARGRLSRGGEPGLREGGLALRRPRDRGAARDLAVRAVPRIERGSDLVPFLRRPSRDCQRLLEKLERWFLRVYDIRNSSAIIAHAAGISSGDRRADRALTWHTPKIHALPCWRLLLAPFVGGDLRLRPRRPPLRPGSARPRSGS